MNLLYIAEGGITNSVFDSQVLHLLRALNSNGVKVKLVLLEEFVQRGNKILSKRFSEVQAEFPECIDMVMIPVVGRISTYVDSVRVLRLVKKKWGKVLDNAIIHARGHIGSYIASKAFVSSKIISDLRGLVSAEVLYYSGGGLRGLTKHLRATELLKMESYILRHSERVFCISAKLRDYVIAEHPHVTSEKITIIPTVVDTHFFHFDANKREEMRRSLGVTNRVVFIYSGSVTKWHVPNRIISFFKHLKTGIPEAFLIFLTNNVGEAQRYFTGVDRTDYAITNAPYKEVPSYLNAADVGILLRENNPVNWVASPTKFGEYLCCGLPVIITKGIGDSEKILSELESGIVLESINSIPDLDMIRSMIEIDRNTVSKKASRIFSIKENVNKIISVYKEIYYSDG